MENWYYPLLPDPILIEEKDAYVFENYQSTIVKNTPLNIVEALFDHEIGHYLFCPYSRGISARLVLAALKALKKTRPSTLQDTSNIILCVNFFQDIIVDTLLLEKNKESREKVIQRMKYQLSGSSDELLVLYTGIINKLFDCGFIYPDRLERYSRRIARVFTSGVMDKSKWDKQCYDTVRILGTLLKTKPDIMQGAGYMSDNLYKLKDQEALRGEEVSLDGIARMVEASEFEQILSVFQPSNDALRRWYHDQSYGVEIYSVKENIEPYPSSLVRWRIDDPVFELDFTYSKSISPTLIPNITTYKRIRDESSFHLEKTVPDLLIVIDSSSSMGGHERGTKTYHAVLAAFKAAHFALRNNAQVAVINFADLCVIQEWTRNEEKIETALIKYIKGNTNIRARQMLELLSKGTNNCLALIITDTQIHNFLTELPYIKIAGEKHHIALFCLDSKNRDDNVTGKLSEIGDVYFIDHIEDLTGLVIEITEEYMMH